MHRLAGEPTVHQTTTQISVQLQAMTKETCRALRKLDSCGRAGGSRRRPHWSRKPKGEGLPRPGLHEEGGPGSHTKRAQNLTGDRLIPFPISLGSACKFCPPKHRLGRPGFEKQSPCPSGLNLWPSTGRGLLPRGRDPTQRGHRLPVAQKHQLLICHCTPETGWV